MKDVIEGKTTEAKIFCKAEFELDDYCILVDGIYYKLAKNKLEKIAVLPVGVFSAEVTFSVVIQSAEPNLEKLQEFAETVLKEKKAAHSKPTGLRTGAAPVKEKFESFAPHHLLDKHEAVINTKLKEAGSRFIFDANSHTLIDEKTKFKIEFHENGSTQSDLYTELDDPALIQNLVDIQIAIVKTFQTLLKETAGAYPKGVTNLYVIQEGLSEAEKKKVDENIMPEFKKRLKTELLKPEFNDIRALLRIESEIIEEKRREEKPIERERVAPGLVV